MKRFSTLRSWSLLFVLAVFFTCIYAYTLDTKLDLNGDNATYITLAHRLAEGHGYTMTTPEGIKPASHFPVGYSAILSIFIRMGLDDLVFFKWLNAIFMFLSIALLYWLLQVQTKQNYLAFGIAALSLASPHLLHFAGMAMSEMSYMFCVTGAMGAMYMYARKEEKDNQTPFYKNIWFYLSIISAAGAYYIRSVGTSIIFALLVFYLFRKEWWQALCSLAGVIMLVAPWMIRNASYGIKSRYFGTIMVVNPWRPEEGGVQSFGDLWHKMLVNIDETVIKGFREVLFPFWQASYEPSTVWGIIVGLVIVAIIIWGAWNIKTWRWMMLAFLAANIGIFALWHGGNGSRYVTPIIPMLYICFYYGIFTIISAIIKKVFTLLHHQTYDIPEHTLWPILLLLLFIPLRTPLKMQHEISRRPYPAAYKNYFQLAKQMNKNLPEGTFVFCRKAELFSYYAPKLYTACYKFDIDPLAVIQDMVNRKADYVILEQLGYSSTPRYLYPAIRQYPQLFPVVQHLPNPDTYLLKFNREQAINLLSNINNHD